MKRRDFIKTGALVVVGTAAAASGIVEIAGADQAAPKFTTLTAHHAETLLRVTRRIFPHQQLVDESYWKIVGELDSTAKADPSTAKLIADGVAQLDGPAGRFLDLDEQHQTAVLKSIETGAFFQKVRTVEMQSLYSDPVTWQALGYEGPAYKFGGYVHKGFNDLAWLPDPPEFASPKPG